MERPRNFQSYLGYSVNDAVVTVPAYFNDSHQQATEDDLRSWNSSARTRRTSPPTLVLAPRLWVACERAKRTLYDDIDFMSILIHARFEVLRDFKTDKGSIYETAINSSISNRSVSGKRLRASALDPATTNASVKRRRGVVASDATDTERIASPDARSEMSVIGNGLPTVLESMVPQHLRRTIEFTLPAGDSASPMPCSAFAEPQLEDAH
ncbi:hypothetical protein M405DRAFT_878056 [Rhizopogon salebrosus TDB-379]|nr:hypothetical protein M405DRAFT_878056 [Rhizopogon salebrosus TDB-379]